jgi:hypothetical protein
VPVVIMPIVIGQNPIVMPSLAVAGFGHLACPSLLHIPSRPNYRRGAVGGSRSAKNKMIMGEVTHNLNLVLFQ